MGRCLIATHTFKQNITGGAFEALAADAGDALTVPNFTQGSNAWLLEAWTGNSANAGEFSIRSPNFHDNTRGIRMAAMFNPTLSGADGDPQLLLPFYVKQKLYAQDTLTVEVNATATNNVQLDYLSYYEDLPGAEQRLATWGQIQGLIKNMVGIRVSVSAGASGVYGTPVALSATDDRLIANHDYAILGGTSQLPCGLMTLVGPETSGRKIGFPLHWDQQKSAGWFVDLSDKYHLPLIPVVNAGNKGSIFLAAADAATTVATAVTLIMADLGQNSGV